MDETNLQLFFVVQKLLSATILGAVRLCSATQVDGYRIKQSLSSAVGCQSDTDQHIVDPDVRCEHIRAISKSATPVLGVEGENVGTAAPAPVAIHWE